MPRLPDNVHCFLRVEPPEETGVAPFEVELKGLTAAELANAERNTDLLVDGGDIDLRLLPFVVKALNEFSQGEAAERTRWAIG